MERKFVGSALGQQVSHFLCHLEGDQIDVQEVRLVIVSCLHPLFMTHFLPDVCA